MPQNTPQIIEKINASNSILIVLSPNPSVDQVASALGLKSFLKKLEKDVVVMNSGAQLDQRLTFLDGFLEIVNSPIITKSFVIDVSTAKTPVEELSYKNDADKISIYLKPKSGAFAVENVTFRTSNYLYQLIVTVGVQKLELLNEFYNNNAELFFETPVLNIDYRGSNENYAQFNLVDLNSSSISEVVFDLINGLEKDLVDKNIATNLLTGIITETNSFQHTRTTPQSFIKASQLVSLGGDQQAVVNNLYKNKSLGFLKLWGRVLARIKVEEELFLAYSAVNEMDIQKSGASEEDAAMIIREMALQLSFVKLFGFMRERADQSTQVFCLTPVSVDSIELFKEYNPKQITNQIIEFEIKESLATAQQKVLDILTAEARKLNS